MVYGVILAGGVGSRMGGDKPKQYLNLKGKPIIVYTIEKFYTCPEFEKIIVLCPAQWVEHTKNLISPNEFHKGSQMSVMCKFYQELSISGCIRLFKSCNRDIVDGEQRRDFVYVGDCVDVIIWMIKHREVSGLFNVGSGEARTFKIGRASCRERV